MRIGGPGRRMAVVCIVSQRRETREHMLVFVHKSYLLAARLAGTQELLLPKTTAKRMAIFQQTSVRGMASI